MFSRSDRREGTILALLALSWAFVLAPILHTVVHATGKAHSHAPATTDRSRSHGDGSFEHSSVVGLEAPSSPASGLSLLASWVPERREPHAPELEAVRRVEQSQAP